MVHTFDPAAASLHRDVLRDIADALIFADRQGIIRLWNPGAQALFGYAQEEALGQSLDLIIPEKLRAAHWQGYHRALERGMTAHGRRAMITRALHKDGATRYVDMSFAVVRNAAGEAIGSAAVARDATERYSEEKRLRRELAELQEKRAN